MGKSQRTQRRYQRIHHHIRKCPFSNWIKQSKLTTIWYQVSKSNFPHWRNRNDWIASIIWWYCIVWCLLQWGWTELLQICYWNHCWKTKTNCWFGVWIWVHEQIAQYQIKSIDSQWWQSQFNMDPVTYWI